MNGVYKWVSRERKEGHVTGEQARDSSLEQVASAANEEWMSAAAQRVRSLAKTGEEFTTDDVWSGIPETINTHEPRAMGAVMRALALENVIRPTGLYRRSRRSLCHARPLCVWVGIPLETRLNWLKDRRTT